MISALLPRVSVARSRRERLLLEPLRMVELRHAWILPHGQAVRGGNVRKAGLLQGSHGRRCVDGVHLPAHVEAGRRALAVVLPLRSLVGTGVFKNLRGVIMIFPIHGFRGPAHVPYLRPASAWTFCSTCLWRNCEALPAPHRCVTLPPCDSAAPKPLASLFAQTYGPQSPGYSAACGIFQ